MEVVTNRTKILMMGILCNTFRHLEKNMKAVIKDYKWNSLALTPKDEIVVISSNSDDLHSINIILTNLCSRCGVCCCHLGGRYRGKRAYPVLARVKDVDSSNMVTFDDIQCKEKNNGYMRVPCCLIL